MVKATFEHEGNAGILTVVTHFQKTVKIACEKRDDEQFRLGGTAINQVLCLEGVLLNKPAPSPTLFHHFRAFRSEQDFFEGIGMLSEESWHQGNRHCYVTEFYDLDMEGNPPGWFISQRPIKDAHYLFVNLDVIDGGGNVMKRYRVSPLTGKYKVM